MYTGLLHHVVCLFTSLLLLVAGTHCAYPRRTGQAEFTWPFLYTGHSYIVQLILMKNNQMKTQCMYIHNTASDIMYRVVTLTSGQSLQIVPHIHLTITSSTDNLRVRTVLADTVNASVVLKFCLQPAQH